MSNLLCLLKEKAKAVGALVSVPAATFIVALVARVGLDLTIDQTLVLTGIIAAVVSAVIVHQLRNTKCPTA